MKTHKGKTMNIKHIFILCLIYTNAPASNAQIKDQDIDGVPDTLDQCPNTPFLNEVDKRGCTTTILTLPSETETDSLTLTVGLGDNTNDDLEERSKFRTGKLKLSYYHDDWSYSINTGYYGHLKDEGALDTHIKVKKRFSLSARLKVSTGFGLKLPTFKFKGNKTDYSLYTSMHYYKTSRLSYFAGAHYTFIQDKEIDEALQNSYGLYLGTGYFFTPQLYANFTFSDTKIKFVREHDIKFLSVSLYYKITEDVFTTLSYGREVDDGDLHDDLNLQMGYKLW